MTAANYNLIIDQGSDFALDLLVKEQEASKDLTGYSARAQMRLTPTSADVAGSFVCTIPLPATDGKINIALPNAVSSGMNSGKYYYDLEIYTANDAYVKRLIQGGVTINPEITR